MALRGVKREDQVIDVSHLFLVHFVFLRDFDRGFPNFGLCVAGAVNTAESPVSYLLEQAPTIQTGVNWHVGSARRLRHEADRRLGIVVLGFLVLGRSTSFSNAAYHTWFLGGHLGFGWPGLGYGGS